MPKILIDDFEEYGCDQSHKHYFNKHTKLYPIDYSYCKEYINRGLIDKNHDYTFRFFHMLKLTLLESYLIFLIINNGFNDMLVDTFIFLSINLFIIMLYAMTYDETPFCLYEFGYETNFNKKWSCYSCGGIINTEGKESIETMNDFELIYLSCGHLHHTACLTSKFVQDTLNHNDHCNYCNSEKSLNILSSIVGDVYYASILAYDFKNDDYVKEMKEANHKMVRRSERIKNKSK